jgi:hypothetical protein
MPFTPFHFGPGLAFKALLQRHISFTVFVFTQVVIDLEPLYYLIRNEWPIHRFFHTYLGATLIAGIGIIIGRPICQWAIIMWKRWHGFIGPSQTLEQESRIPLKAAILGAFIGTYSHIALDSIMHREIRPYAPFSDANGLLQIISLAQLYWACIISGVIGLVVLFILSMIKRHPSTP